MRFWTKLASCIDKGYIGSRCLVNNWVIFNIYLFVVSEIDGQTVSGDRKVIFKYFYPIYITWTEIFPFPRY